MEYYRSVSDIVWSESFWFPKNYTWKDLENKPGGIYHPQFSDLLIPFPLAIVLFIVRYLFENCVSLPLGRSIGVKATVEKPSHQSPVLEKSYHSSKHPDHNTIKALSKQTDVTERQIERWFRQRRNQDRPSNLIKFSECCWRFTFYFSALMYGLVILSSKPWFWDTRHCWYGYPQQNVSSDLYWYYIIEMAFYWSLMISQFMDVKRKDFWEMLIHHCVTLCLMCFSWVNNMIRIGTLILCIHDVVDPLLEGAKIAKYANQQKLCDILFGVFTVMWLVTRMILFPTRLIYSGLIESSYIVGPCTAVKCQNVLLVVLQVLHAIWFYLILKAVFSALKTGQVQKDERSEEESDGEADEQNVGDTKQNGVDNKDLKRRSYRKVQD